MILKHDGDVLGEVVVNRSISIDDALEMLSIDIGEEIEEGVPRWDYDLFELVHHVGNKVIFDNGGGVTLQLQGIFAHSYNDAERAAEDYREAMDNPDESDCWEGNEPELLVFVPTSEEIRNGGYFVMDDEDVQEAIKKYREDGEVESSWGNIKSFIETLGVME